jgi:hypothetical protein
MTSVIVRTTVAARLAAVVLVVLMASPLAAPFSNVGGSLEIATTLAENARNEDATLTALVEPLAALVVETRFSAVALDIPPALAIAITLAQTQVLRV